MEHKVYFGHASDVLSDLQPQSVHACVTSPPYWGLRSYMDGEPLELGKEQTPAEYVLRLVDVFRDVRRVLRDDGVLWLNLGDCYTSGGRQRRAPDQKLGAREMDCRAATPYGLKPKDMVGIPWRVAFALQADGWYLRSDVIWAKGVSFEAPAAGWSGGSMPGSQRDRPSTSHEYVFLLTKSARYWYDYYALREPTVDGKGLRNLRDVWTINTRAFAGAHFATFPPSLVRPMVVGSCPPAACSVCGRGWKHVVERTEDVDQTANGSRFDRGKTGSRDGGDRTQVGDRLLVADRGYEPDCVCVPKQDAVGNRTYTGFNARWAEGGREVEDKGYEEDYTCHAQPVPGTVLDPFAGSGTVARVAWELGRSSISIDLNPDYEPVMRERLGPEMVEDVVWYGAEQREGAIA